VHPELSKYLQEIDKHFLVKFADKLNAKLDFSEDETYHLNEFNFLSTTNGKVITY